MKHGKKYMESCKAVDSTKQYDSVEALDLVCKNAKAKFDETVENTLCRMRTFSVRGMYG